MTYSTGELYERGVSDTALAWRRWRRDMRLTQTEAAAMAQVNERTVVRFELGGRALQRTIDKFSELMARWDESKRPARPPERRGGYRPRRSKGTQEGHNR